MIRMRPLLLLCISIASVTGEVAGVAEGEDAERRGKRDLSDVDQMDSSSDTSGTGGSDQDLDHGDPNLTNPQNKMMEVDNVRRWVRAGFSGVSCSWFPGANTS